jgi:DNA-binding transcriptional MocR family regulator
MDPGAGAQLDRYGAGLGEPNLREAAWRELKQVRQLDLVGSTVVVTAGSNMAFDAIAQVICRSPL